MEYVLIDGLAYLALVVEDVLILADLICRGAGEVDVQRYMAGGPTIGGGESGCKANKYKKFNYY